MTAYIHTYSHTHRDCCTINSRSAPALLELSIYYIASMHSETNTLQLFCHNGIDSSTFSVYNYYTLSICELHPLHVLLFDLAYSTWRSLRVTFLFFDEEGAGLSVLSTPPDPPPEILFFIFSWSSHRRELKPDISLMA